MALLFFIISLLCTTGVTPAQFQIQPESDAVLTGSEARFNASLKGKWQIMIWEVQKLLVMTISAETGPIPSSERFSATNYSTGSTSRWEFSIRNVSRNDSGPVTCIVQGQFGARTAQLLVQESGTVDILGGNLTAAQDQQVEFQCVTSGWFPEPAVNWSRNGEVVETSLFNTTTSQSHGYMFNSTSILKFNAVSNATVECLVTVPALISPLSSSVHLVVVPNPTDWTVLIAVVASVGGFALLVLLILGIIFCYQRRKVQEPGYQDEMRARTQSQISGEGANGTRRGQVNLGYQTDGQTSVPPSESGDSSFSKTDDSNICEIPDIIKSNLDENGHGGARHTPGGFRKHRHVTIV
ncbi:immunoglobulin superfamily member 5 isoform X1 [Lampris incognitus]|uniref:immunoglobulin superfamily member 5 isoform X1 n=1 Tax=Lampris incognitus TaxID=2546036 RepID=UPI0024B4A0C8|nr:immunoglobulin superfamily member 5 isoform X1 [Lampris incognitus]